MFQLGDIQAGGTHEQGSWVSMTPDEFFPHDRPVRPVHAQGLARQDAFGRGTAGRARTRTGRLAGTAGPCGLGSRTAAGPRDRSCRRRATSTPTQARRQVVAGRSRRPALLVARRRLRGLRAGDHADHRSRILLRRPARLRTRRWPRSTAKARGRRTTTTRTKASIARSTSRAPICCASTARTGRSGRRT